MKASRPITAKQAERERRKLKSVWSKESQLTQRVLIQCLVLLETIAANQTKTRGAKR
jgi:hypothetical protein